MHRALNHKGGLSEDTRMKILNVANDLNYTNNYIASALSRKSIDIAIVLPNPQGFGKYYFSYMIKESETVMRSSTATTSICWNAITTRRNLRKKARSKGFNSCTLKKIMCCRALSSLPYPTARCW